MSVFKIGAAVGAVFAATAYFTDALDHGIQNCKPDGDGGAYLEHSDGRSSHVKSVDFSRDGSHCYLDREIIVPVKLTR